MRARFAYAEYVSVDDVSGAYVLCYVSGVRTCNGVGGQLTVNDVIKIVSVADACDEEIVAVVTQVGVERVAEILVDEIVCRFDRPQVEVGETVAIGLRLALGGESISSVVLVSPTEVTWKIAHVDELHATIEQDLVDVVRMVFGFGVAQNASSRRLELRDSGSMETFKQPPAWFYIVQRLLATMDFRDHVSIAELASRYGADKWGIHLYAQHYQRHFEPLRHRPLTILEIGVGGFGVGGFADPAKGGASLRMWKNYFPRAWVYGFDIADKRGLSEQRIEIIQGDQSDPAALGELVRATGPLDIVIDDGSHVNGHVVTSFDTLFPYVRNGGLYVIEDLQTSYWPRFGGTSDNFDDQSTSVGYLKSLVDGLNYEEILGTGQRCPHSYDHTIKGLHFYHNIAFVEKGVNIEGGGPDWVRYGPK